MKLGSLNRGRDGALVVVSSDLARQRAVPEIAATLQGALDDWAKTAPALAAVAAELNAGKGPSEPFDPHAMAAPLPRAFQWADGSAYATYLELSRKGAGAPPAPPWTDPMIYQGGSDGFLAPGADILAESEDWGIDFEAEVAVITDDVPVGVGAEAAKGHLKLFMLANDVSLRALAAAELLRGFGFFQSKPPTAFSPVAVTPDELGPAWDGQKLHLPMLSHRSGQLFGRPDTGTDLRYDMATLVAHAAKTRALAAGSILGSGAVANREASGLPKPVADGGVGHSCIAELRAVETMASGRPETPFLKFGDVVRIEMLDRQGRSIFGAIEQTVRRYVPSA